MSEVLVYILDYVLQFYEKIKLFNAIDDFIAIITVSYK